jgi:hypothetical protein
MDLSRSTLTPEEAEALDAALAARYSRSTDPRSALTTAYTERYEGAALREGVRQCTATAMASVARDVLKMRSNQDPVVEADVPSAALYSDVVCSALEDLAQLEKGICTLTVATNSEGKCADPRTPVRAVVQEFLSECEKHLALFM